MAENRSLVLTREIDLTQARTSPKRVTLPGGARFVEFVAVPGTLTVHLDNPNDGPIFVDRPGRIALCDPQEPPIAEIHVTNPVGDGVAKLSYSQAVRLDFEAGGDDQIRATELAHILPYEAALAVRLKDMISGDTGDPNLFNAEGTVAQGMNTGYVAALGAWATQFELSGTNSIETHLKFSRHLPIVQYLNPVPGGAGRHGGPAGYVEIEGTFAYEWATKNDFGAAYWGIGRIQLTPGFERHGILWEFNASAGGRSVLQAKIVDQVSGGGQLFGANVLDTDAGDVVELTTFRLGIRVGVKADGTPFVQWLLDGEVTQEVTGELASALDWSDFFEPTPEFGIAIGNSLNLIRLYSGMGEGIRMRFVELRPPDAP